MKKSASAPNLAKSASGKTIQSAASGLAASSRRAAGSSNSPNAVAQDDASAMLHTRGSFVGSTRHLNRSSATTVRRPSGCQLTQAVTSPALPPPTYHSEYSALEQVVADSGKWFLEGARHGIASTDCFSLFGYPSEAPNLRDDAFQGTAEDSAQEQSRKIAEAACLLTPASGQERDAGSQLRSTVSRAELINQMQTQMRFADEMRRVAEAESLHASRQCEAHQASAVRAAASSPRYRRERRLRGEDTFCTDPGEPPRMAAVSPRTAKALAESYGTDAVERNTRTIDEDDWDRDTLASKDSVAANIELPHPHGATNLVPPVEAESPLSQVVARTMRLHMEGHSVDSGAESPPTVATLAPDQIGTRGARVELTAGDRAASAPVISEASSQEWSRPLSSNAKPSNAKQNGGKGSSKADDSSRKGADSRTQIPDKTPNGRKIQQDDDKENGGGWGMSNAVPFVRKPRSEKSPTSVTGPSTSDSSNSSTLRRS